MYCCYIKWHYLKRNECATGVWMGNVSVAVCSWVELGKEILFYVTLHWMLVCCGYEYLKYFLVRKTGDQDFIERCSRSRTRLRTVTKETEQGQREDEEAELEEHRLYLNWTADPRTVSLCDIMWSFVTTVQTDSSWCENTPKKSLRVSWNDCWHRLRAMVMDNVKMTFFPHGKVTWRWQEPN